jgi:hypothetical protein
MTFKHGPTPKVTVEHSWLNKPIDERLTILRYVAPDKVDGLSLLMHAALKEDSDRAGPTPRQARAGGPR